MTRDGDQQAQGGAEKQKEQNGYWKNIFRWIDNHDKRVVAVATIVMAAFTVVLAIANYGLWKGARKHSERELRAYVSITEIGTRNFVPNGRAETKVTIKNSGKTPAYDLRIVTTFDIHKIPRDEFRHSSAQGTDESKGVLGPGIEIIAGGISRRPLTPQEHQATVRGEIAAFFFGMIEYTDAFKKRRFTNFRYVGKLSREAVSWNVSEKGNEAG